MRDFGGKFFKPNATSADASATVISPTPTGFSVDSTDAGRNQNNSEYIWFAIRRADPYVGKPADAATDIFDIDGSGNQATPGFTCGFPVDMRIGKAFNATEDWWFGTRKQPGAYLRCNTADEELSLIHI